MSNQNSTDASSKKASNMAADAATNVQEAFETSTENFIKVVNESTKHTQNMGEKALDAMKQAGLSSLDAYQKSFDSFLGLQKKFVGASGNDTVDEALAAQMKLLTDISNATTSVMREVLK